MTTKNVIMVWTQRVCNIKDSSSYSWGLGDLIEGTLYLYFLCREKGYSFHVSFEHHPWSKYMISSFNNEISIDIDSVPYIPRGQVENEILSYPNSTTISLLTNEHYDPLKIDHESRQFLLRTLFTMKSETRQALQQRWNKYPFLRSVPYIVVHYRLGDSGIISRSCDNIEVHVQRFQKLVRLLDPNMIIVLLSDNVLFKEKIQDIKTSSDLWIIPSFDIIHIGFQYQDDHKDIMYDTLFDFFVIQYAQCVYTYSIYDWISGFAREASRLFDVPLFHITT